MSAPAQNNLSPFTTTRASNKASVDEGGHFIGAQFNGAFEQINYSSQHVHQNQRPRYKDALTKERDRADPTFTPNWNVMESNWAENLRKNKHAYVEQYHYYPASPVSYQNEDKRVETSTVDYWVDGHPNRLIFGNTENPDFKSHYE